jgi:hypothetical protein
LCEVWDITNLVLLAASAETRLAKPVNNRCAALLVVVLLRDVVVLALKGLAGGVLALTLDDANAECALDDVAEIVLGEVSLLFGREMLHDGGQRC